MNSSAQQTFAILLGSLLMALFSTDDQKDEFAHAGAVKKLQTLVAGMLPLTPTDVVQSAKEDKWSNLQAPVAIVLTILGAGGNVYDEKYYERAVNYFLEKKDEFAADVRGRIEAKVKVAKKLENQAKELEKGGKPVPQSLADRIEELKSDALSLIREARR